MNLTNDINNVTLMEERSLITSSELKELFPNKKLCICDFPLKGCEEGIIDEESIVFHDILIIDHHAPILRNYRKICSTSLAIQYVKKNDPLPQEQIICINHTDCDSILSMLIMRGILPPEDKYGEAAIAADHMGQENKIADLLQGLQKVNDVSLSVRNLFALLRGNPLDEKAEQLLRGRLADREKIKRLVEMNKFKQYDEITYCILDKKVDAALAPNFLPEAKVILLASPMPPESPKKWEIKVRLGIKIKDIYLNELGLPDYGGRWNAGSTKRDGGTNIEPEEFLRILSKRLRNFLNEK